jgi:GPH family glycoside/pentoside/hexuronide:cation symporter
VANAAYLFVTFCGFFLFFAAVFGPYLAMMPELTSDSAERNRLATLQAVFAIAGTFVGALFGLLVHLCAGPHPPDPAAGFRRAGLLVALIGASSCALPLLVRRRAIEVSAEEQQFTLLQGVRQTLTSRPFRHYILAYLMVWGGLQVIMAAMVHLPVARLGARTDQNSAWGSYLQLTALVSALGSYPLLYWAMGRWGRARVWTAGMLWFALCGPLLGFCRSLPTAIIVLILAGPAVGGLMILPHALLSDVCDHDAAATGVRREAMFFGMQGLMTKLAQALTTAVVLVLLETFGRTAEHPWGVVACPLASALCVAVGLAMFRGYDAGGDAAGQGQVQPERPR